MNHSSKTGIRTDKNRCLFRVSSRFQHCTGHITTGSFVGRANSTYSWSRFCNGDCWPSVNNYQLSHIRSGVWTVYLRGATRVCVTTAPPWLHVTIRWRKLIVGTLVEGCRCATPWCDFDLTFDLDVVTLTFKILFRLYFGTCKALEVDT